MFATNIPFEYDCRFLGPIRWDAVYLLITADFLCINLLPQTLQCGFSTPGWFLATCALYSGAENGNFLSHHNDIHYAV